MTVAELERVQESVEENHQVGEVSTVELQAPPNSKRAGMHLREEMLGSCTCIVSNTWLMVVCGVSICFKDSVWLVEIQMVVERKKILHHLELVLLLTVQKL